MTRMTIQVTPAIQRKLDEERKQGTTAAGLIRFLLEQHFRKSKGVAP
jgi:hypothetical protein